MRIKIIYFAGFAVMLVSLFFMNCESKNPIGIDDDEVFQVRVLKWYEGRRAAVSLTYDACWGADPRLQDAVDAVLSRNLRIDFELVTGLFDTPAQSFLVDQMRNEMIPKGIHFFGHGHDHICHDSLSFDLAYISFKKCYDLMKQWGLSPNAYAYPGSAGRLETTQLANKLAGFICARGVTYKEHEFYICPNSTTQPSNWYYLPSIPVALEYDNYIQNHDEMAPILSAAIDSSAWVIIMYHAIGIPEGWGYYPYEEFLRDLDQIAAEDFWCANFDNVAQYIQEKNNLSVEKYCYSSKFGNWKYYITFRDNLDSDIYTQPLTIEFIFSPKINVKKFYIDPPIESKTEYDVTENMIRLNIVPDEVRYRINIRN